MTELSHVPAYYPQTLVVQPDLFGGVLPEIAGITLLAADTNGGSKIDVYYPKKPVVQPRTTLREAAGSTATAKAHAPFALTRSGGTPMPARAAQTASPKRASVTGRVDDGPACIGCVQYQPMGIESGACVATGRKRAAVDRRACGLYQFYGPGGVLRERSRLAASGRSGG
jgi:hypothetical protein